MAIIKDVSKPIIQLTKVFILPEMVQSEMKRAEEDRQALFGEAQQVEQQVRGVHARKLEAQASAAHYRELLKTQM